MRSRDQIELSLGLSEAGVGIATKKPGFGNGRDTLARTYIIVNCTLFSMMPEAMA